MYHALIWGASPCGCAFEVFEGGPSLRGLLLRGTPGWCGAFLTPPAPVGRCSTLHTHTHTHACNATCLSTHARPGPCLPPGFPMAPALSSSSGGGAVSRRFDASGIQRRPLGRLPLSVVAPPPSTAAHAARSSSRGFSFTRPPGRLQAASPSTTEGVPVRLLMGDDVTASLGNAPSSRGLSTQRHCGVGGVRRGLSFDQLPKRRRLPGGARPLGGQPSGVPRHFRTVA